MSAINVQNTHIIPFEFVYHQPETVKEAVKLLEAHPDAMPMAGGTDLVPKMKQRLLTPGHLVNLKRIRELQGIEDRGGEIHIGAATRLRELERSDTVKRRLPLLHSCIRSIGSVQIRNMGTIGGNVCNASPAADGALGLISLDATVHITGPEETRTVKAVDFFVGPGKTVLGRGELVAGFTVPVPGPDVGTCFLSVGRTALDISTISIAVALRMRGGVIQEARVALGSVAPTPIRLQELEKWLRGRSLDESTVVEAAGMVSKGIKPITDIRGSAEYRSEAARGMAIEALTRAGSLKGGS